MPRRARKIPSSTPRPEELAATVIPMGIRAGKITADGTGGYLIDQELLRQVAPYLANGGILGLPKRQWHWRKRQDRTKYIEDFLKEVEHNIEMKSVRRLYRETSWWEQNYALPCSLGMGLVAVHIYYQNHQKP